jgi:hypothetical protein
MIEEFARAPIRPEAGPSNASPFDRFIKTPRNRLFPPEK